MDQFAGDVAAMLEIALIGGGLVVLYYALKEGSKLLKAAGYRRGLGILVLCLYLVFLPSSGSGDTPPYLYNCSQ